MFKRFVFITLVALAATSLFAAAGEIYTVDRAHSNATFQVKHLISRVNGQFRDFDAVIQIDPQKPQASSVVFTIKAASIDTGIADRDKHLRSGDFFAADQHPEITFRSTAIKPAKKKDLYAVTGDLTIRGVTKRVTIPVEFLGFVKDPWGNEKAAFSIATTINRKDFGIVWNTALDNGGLLLGEEVAVNIELQAKKTAAPAASAPAAK